MLGDRRWLACPDTLILCHDGGLPSTSFSPYSIDAIYFTVFFPKSLIPYPATAQIYCSISQQPGVLQ